jgi:hypothetical protein
MLRRELRQLIDQCHRDTVADCRIIEARLLEASNWGRVDTPLA